MITIYFSHLKQRYLNAVILLRTICPCKILWRLSQRLGAKFHWMGDDRIGAPWIRRWTCAFGGHLTLSADTVNRQFNDMTTRDQRRQHVTVIHAQVVLKIIGWLSVSWVQSSHYHLHVPCHINNNNNNAICIAQIRRKQQMGYCWLTTAICPFAPLILGQWSM